MNWPRTSNSGGSLQKITKSELARRLSEEMGFDGALANQLVRTFFQALTESIIQGNRIEARGFEVFEVSRANARNGRNPRTGERVFVPARRKVKFKPGKILKTELSKPIETRE